MRWSARRAIALAALALFACSSGEEAPPASAREPTRAPAPSPPAEPTPEVVEPAGAALESRFPCIAGDPEAGRDHYETLCASCHGAAGDGKGPAAAGLNPQPTRHDDGAILNPLSNEHLFTVIRDGGPAVGKSPLMAPWGGTLSDDDVWDVVAFMRSLAAPAYRCPQDRPGVPAP